MRRRLHLPVLFALTAAISASASAYAQPAPGQIYSGTHSASNGGFTIEVNQAGTGINNFGAHDVPGGWTGGKCTIEGTLSFSKPVPIVDNRFEYTTPSITLRGSFPRPGYAEGVAEFHNVVGDCAVDTKLDWNARTRTIPTVLPTPPPAPTPLPTPVPEPAPPPVAAAEPSTSTECPPGEQPRFVAGFAELNDYLQGALGDPLTCEFADPNGNGDMYQRTSNGLAFWRKSTNTPSFTSGDEHWAHTVEGWVSWTGASLDPPQ